MRAVIDTEWLRERFQTTRGLDGPETTPGPIRQHAAEIRADLGRSTGWAIRALRIGRCPSSAILEAADPEIGT